MPADSAAGSPCYSCGEPRDWAGATVLLVGPGVCERVARRCRAVPVVAVGDARLLVPKADAHVTDALAGIDLARAAGAVRVFLVGLATEEAASLFDRAGFAPGFRIYDTTPGSRFAHVPFDLAILDAPPVWPRRPPRDAGSNASPPPSPRASRAHPRRRL